MSGNTSGVRGFGDSTLEALVEVMFLAASADGEFSSVERDHFFKSVESLTDGRIPSPRLEALIAKASPMPLEAPVIQTTLPDSCVMFVCPRIVIDVILPRARVSQT